MTLEQIVFRTAALVPNGSIDPWRLTLRQIFTAMNAGVALINSIWGSGGGGADHGSFEDGHAELPWKQRNHDGSYSIPASFKLHPSVQW